MLFVSIEEQVVQSAMEKRVLERANIIEKWGEEAMRIVMRRSNSMLEMSRSETKATLIGWSHGESLTASSKIKRPKVSGKRKREKISAAVFPTAGTTESPVMIEGL